MEKKIPTKIESYDEGQGITQTTLSDDGMTYEPVKGQIVNVTYWVQYPNYDFIFGVPAKDNPYAELEVGFFQYRNTKHKKVIMGVYVDCNELEELAHGFTKLIEISKLTNPALWQKHQKLKDVEMPLPKSNTPKVIPEEKK